MTFFWLFGSKIADTDVMADRGIGPNQPVGWLVTVARDDHDGRSQPLTRISLC
jgi:hypothetical protein